MRRAIGQNCCIGKTAVLTDHYLALGAIITRYGEYSLCCHLLKVKLKLMEIHELVLEMKLLERRLTLYEEKYGVLSEDFYAALISGQLSRYDEFDETRADFSRWKGIYETWLRRKQAYVKQIGQRELVSILRLQPSY